MTRCTAAQLERRLLRPLAFLVVGGSLRAPLPGTLGELREEGTAWQQLAGEDWLCTAIPLVGAAVP